MKLIIITVLITHKKKHKIIYKIIRLNIKENQKACLNINDL